VLRAESNSDTTTDHNKTENHTTNERVRKTGREEMTRKKKKRRETQGFSAKEIFFWE